MEGQTTLSWGRLGERGLYGVLWDLGRQHRTGLLEARSSEVCRSFFLKEGLIEYASSTAEDEWLGCYLLTSDVISTDQFNDTARMIVPGERPQGRLLVDRGYLTKAELALGIHDHIDWLVSRSAAWRDARAEFRDAAPPDRMLWIPGVEPVRLVGQQIRAIDRFDVVAGLLADPASIPEPVVAEEFSILFDGFDLSPTDEEVLWLVNGRRSCLEIVRRAPGDALETLKSLLLFIVSGLVRLRLVGIPAPEALFDLDPIERTNTWVVSRLVAEALDADYRHLLNEEHPARVATGSTPESGPVEPPDEGALDLAQLAEWVAALLAEGGADEEVDHGSHWAAEPPAALTEAWSGRHPGLDASTSDDEEPLERQQIEFAEGDDLLHAARSAIEDKDRIRASSMAWLAFLKEPTGVQAARCADVLVADRDCLPDARQYLRRACERDPLETEHFRKLALVELKLGALEACLRTLREALVLHPDDRVLRWLYREAYRRYEAGRRRRIIARLNRA